MPKSINYANSVNKAIDYIRKNLSEKILLEDIANEVHISKYHFHRIFSSYMDETVLNFIKRLRLEKAASSLVSNRDLSITKVAYDVGYSSSQQFSRDFKSHFGQTPSEYLEENNRLSKIDHIENKDYHVKSNNPQSTSYEVEYTSDNGRPKVIYKSSIMKNIVSVETLPETTVAYIRHIGPYKGDAELFGRLFSEISKWAGTKGLLNENSQMYSVYYDDSDITDDSKTMVDVCVSVPEGTKGSDNISIQTIPGGEYAISKFEIKGPKDYAQAWDSIYSDWLPESGYQPDDRPAFELYRGDSMNKKEGDYTHKTEICVPVKSA